MLTTMVLPGITQALWASAASFEERIAALLDAWDINTPPPALTADAQAAAFFLRREVLLLVTRGNAARARDQPDL